MLFGIFLIGNSFLINNLFSLGLYFKCKRKNNYKEKYRVHVGYLSRYF